MKQENIDWIANNPFYTKRFSYYVGRKCRAMTIKALEKEYMQEQLRRNPVTAPRIIGIDEISLKKGHTYRIIVSDLERNRPIWFGGEDRAEESLDMFYNWLGANKINPSADGRAGGNGYLPAVRQVWKAFEKSTRKNIPSAAIRRVIG